MSLLKSGDSQGFLIPRRSLTKTSIQKLSFPQTSLLPLPQHRQFPPPSLPTFVGL